MTDITLVNSTCFLNATERNTVFTVCTLLICVFLMAPAIKMLYTSQLLTLAILEKMTDRNLWSFTPLFCTMDGPRIYPQSFCVFRDLKTITERILNLQAGFLKAKPLIKTR